MILITGAAGKTGRAVVKALLGIRQSKEPIRILVRRADQIQPMLDLGVQEVFVGDILSSQILDQAVRGVRVIYHIPPNVNPEEVAIGQAIIRAAQSARVGQIIYHSVLHPQVEDMPHHWRKMRIEELLFTSGVAYTILQPAVYMQNIMAQWEQILTRGVYSVPYAVSTRLGMVDLDDVAAVAANVLTEDGHEGAVYELAGPAALSQEEVAIVLGQVLGRAVSAETQARETWKARAQASGLGEYQVDTLLKMFIYYEKYGFWGNPRVLSWLLRREPTRFKDFVERIYHSVDTHP